MTTVLLLIGLWLVFNLSAPYAVLLRAQPISWGRLPMELLTSETDRKVRFCMTKLTGGYGYSVWSPLGLNLVVFDKGFFAHARPDLIRFVIAHELGHFHQNHHKKRWVAIVTGLVLIPAVRRWLLRMEDDADVEATKRTQFTRNMFPELL